MPIFALLTRLLLCLSLVLNGAGTAVAMPGMQDMVATPADAGHATPQHHAAKHAHAAHAASAAMPCHPQAAVPPPAADHGDGHCPKQVGKHGCCGAAGCQCPHAQPLPALLALPLALPVAAQRPFPGGRQAGRGAPGLPRLERPPSA